MAVTPYNTPAFTPYNPYANAANPYAPNPMAYGQPSYVPTAQPTIPSTASQTAVQQPTTPVQTSFNVNGPFIVVNGIQGAKDVQVPANQTAWMMDQNAPQFYVKSADNLGICKMDYYRFEKFDPDAEAQAAAQMQAQRQNVNQTVDMSNFMTRDEVEAIVQEKFEEAKSLLAKIAPTSTAKSTGSKPKTTKDDVDA